LHFPPYDRGIFSIYFFNLVNVRKYEAIFQDAGVPHAYLEGRNVELMANSDNVLRGGLTSKHIDIPELLAVVRCAETRPHIIRPAPTADPRESDYPSPAQEFAIAKIETSGPELYGHTSRSMEILFVLDGSAVLSGSDRIPLSKGCAAVVLAGEAYRIETTSPRAVIFRASVPDEKKVNGQ
jgi:mannose-6-phosphate isomerase